MKLIVAATAGLALGLLVGLLAMQVLLLQLDAYWENSQKEQMANLTRQTTETQSQLASLQHSNVLLHNNTITKAQNCVS